MTTTFSVAAPGTKFFRIELTNLCANLNTPTHQPFFQCRFDNYLTWETPPATFLGENGKFPEWGGYSRCFIYETLHSDAFLVKLFKIELCDVGHQYLGEATIDLETLARGPENVSLALLQGENTSVGRVDFKFEMLEMCETRVVLPEFFVTLTGKAVNPDVAAVSVVKASTASGWDCQDAQRTANSDTIRFAGCRDHFFCITSKSLMEQNGLNFEIFPEGLSGNLAGRATVRFADYVTTLNGQDVTFDFKEIISQGHQDLGEVTGKMSLFGLPSFSQMYAGHTIDGVVCNGQVYRIDQPHPPFFSGSITVGTTV